MTCLRYQPLHFIGKFLNYIFPLAGQFDQRFEIIGLARVSGIGLNISLQAAAFLQRRLRVFRITPEVGLRYFLFKLENLRTLTFYIKDTLVSAISFPRRR
jgi:hypothetical protein